MTTQIKTAESITFSTPAIEIAAIKDRILTFAAHGRNWAERGSTVGAIQESIARLEWGVRSGKRLYPWVTMTNEQRAEIRNLFALVTLADRESAALHARGMWSETETLADHEARLTLRHGC